MRSSVLVGAVALFATGAIVSPVGAQQRAAPADTGMTLTPGAVMRVILLRPNPGMAPEVMRDIRQHLLPILEEEKAAGILVNYSIMTNTTTDSPEDWSVGYTLTYPNWAALDSVGARTNPITLRHYGSAEARTAAATHRAQLGTVVHSGLVRLQIVSH
jgi:hypothetical protein